MQRDDFTADDCYGGSIDDVERAESWNRMGGWAAPPLSAYTIKRCPRRPASGEYGRAAKARLYHPSRDRVGAAGINRRGEDVNEYLTTLGPSALPDEWAIVWRQGRAVSAAPRDGWIPARIPAAWFAAAEIGKARPVAFFGGADVIVDCGTEDDGVTVEDAQVFVERWARRRSTDVALLLEFARDRTQDETVGYSRALVDPFVIGECGRRIPMALADAGAVRWLDG